MRDANTVDWPRGLTDHELDELDTSERLERWPEYGDAVRAAVASTFRCPDDRDRQCGGPSCPNFHRCRPGR